MIEDEVAAKESNNSNLIQIKNLFNFLLARISTFLRVNFSFASIFLI